MNHPSSDLLETLQLQFFHAVARWTNYGTEVEPALVSLPNLVCLLQSVGYSIRRIDSVLPEDMSPLRNNQKGTRVVVTCGHSGQRCFLELPEEADQCNSIIKNYERDSFWEVTATSLASKNSSLIETGADAVLAVSKELNTLLKHTLICLTHMIQGTLKYVEPEEAGLGKSGSNSNTSSPKQGAKRLSEFIQELVNVPNIIISSPKATDSPVRHRSLDALTLSPDERIPLPGSFTPKVPRTKQTIITKSSPKINLFGKNEAVSSSDSTIENQQNETVVELLRKAISLLEVNKNQQVSPAIPNTDKEVKKTTFSKGTNTDFALGGLNMRPKSASRPSLGTKRRVKSNSASRTPTTSIVTTRLLKAGSAKVPSKSNNL